MCGRLTPICSLRVRNMAELLLFHLLFFWKSYTEPFTYSRSELLSTFYPSWIHLGRLIRERKSLREDPYYWLNYHAHPVLSSYYPPHCVSAWVSTWLSLDASFKLLLWSVTLHHLVASFGWYILLSHVFGPQVALFGALTFTYAGYNIKQQPCIVFTITWLPFVLLGLYTQSHALTSISSALLILGGYLPLALYILPTCLLLALVWHVELFALGVGVLGATVCLIPFLKYLPKTIRAHQHDNIGCVPWWHNFSLVFPRFFRHHVNGVGFWEMSCYVGLIPLLFATLSSSVLAFLGIVTASALRSGAYSSYFPRIPARWSFIFQFWLVWASLEGMTSVVLGPGVLTALTLIQALDLYLNNHDLIPTHPYSELPEKPSRAFNTPLTQFLVNHLGTARVSGLPYPLFTGHINKLRTLGYSGGMQLRLMAKWRNDTNSNGSGQHDYFVNGKDGTPLDIARVKYAYTKGRINWPRTCIKYLYRNPRFTTA